LIGGRKKEQSGRAGGNYLTSSGHVRTDRKKLAADDVRRRAMHRNGDGAPALITREIARRRHQRSQQRQPIWRHFDASSIGLARFNSIIVVATVFVDDFFG